VCADRVPAPARIVPDTFQEEDRKEYLAIAKRAQAEAAHSYTVMALGLQVFRSTKIAVRERGALFS
tara:strand:+ start:1298 stop:1495 length:198 start_codon:yes stop_codon:yes gene_type:complete